MSGTPWVQVSPQGVVIGFTRTETYQPGTIKKRLFYLFLESVTTQQFNWKLVVSENNNILFSQPFLLSGASNTTVIAQQMADQILTQYLKGNLP